MQNTVKIRKLQCFPTGHRYEKKSWLIHITADHKRQDTEGRRTRDRKRISLLDNLENMVQLHHNNFIERCNV